MSLDPPRPCSYDLARPFAEVTRLRVPLWHVTIDERHDFVTTLHPALPEFTQPQSEFALLGLPKPLVSGLERQGITAPFPIQRAAIPDILAGNDVLGRGQTGSGKTLAFGLPMMVRISGDKARPKRPRAIILVPTRELALQVNDALEPLGRGLSLRMKTVVGGMSMGKQIEALRRGVEVVVATPGRLTDLMRQGECYLDDVQVTVLDEADHMCDLGFFPVVSSILEETPADGQRLLFSATLDGDVDKLVERFLKDPVTHSLDPATSSVDTMEHHLVQVRRDDKIDVTAEIANREGRTILFVRTQHGVDRVVKQLARVGVKAGGLHGGKRQNQRTRILGEFREGNVQVLVCTDVAARGIHVDDVSLVLHVDPPSDHKSYLHRGGRTARAGERGSVLTLVMPNERRSTESMARKAGIQAERHRVAPGDPVLAEIAGARQPSGESIPVWEPDVRKPLRARRENAHGDDSPRSERPRRGYDGSRRPRRFDGPRDDRRFDGPRGERRFDGPREERRFDGPRDERRSDGPRDDRRFDGPRERRFDGPRDERRFDGPRGERRFEGPREERRFDGPRDDRRFDGPRDDRRVDGPRPERHFDGPRGERRFDGPRSSERRFDGPRPERRFDGPRSERRFDGPRPERRFDGPRPERRFEGPRSERRFDGPRERGSAERRPRWTGEERRTRRSGA
ncbi:DEAD/DEAH box helicase [Streptosporangiaceae bacterium NEAU-GS5]|nr:DEAD/DEAH box helicase [Streptosporangiaceae bacterium NEAU-GS5]